MSQDKQENDNFGIPKILAQGCQWPLVRGKRQFANREKLNFESLRMNEWTVVKSRPTNNQAASGPFVCLIPSKMFAESI